MHDEDIEVQLVKRELGLEGRMPQDYYATVHLDVQLAFHTSDRAAEPFDGVFIDKPTCIFGTGGEMVSESVPCDGWWVAYEHTTNTSSSTTCSRAGGLDTVGHLAEHAACGDGMQQAAVVVSLSGHKHPSVLRRFCPLCGPHYPIRLSPDCTPLAKKSGRPSNAARAKAPKLTAAAIMAHLEIGMSLRVSILG